MNVNEDNKDVGNTRNAARLINDAFLLNKVSAEDGWMGALEIASFVMILSGYDKKYFLKIAEHVFDYCEQESDRFFEDNKPQT